ncbi:MAG: hypothetical protein COY81_00720 [Candidatus Pacebacteria bacterium CG_4_10_14_0_8_um_filter_43_12]|nr:MAG: hypothetical protein COU66_03685 [Candidatus Pacebacteria bacterium CG10_big_fil_rev_8_21_14_0_10_44_11]PIY79804.1 MAG: hypothetical protein COY81_00720 [Candidatus Pacebacteria bacterium CG_4_10_14_0_8_um_filter_43_12]
MNTTNISKRLFQWLDQHALLLLASFLVAFIPIYPKLPLFDLIPGYLVRVRLEDFFVLLAVAVWLAQVIRKKISWRTPVTFAIFTYALVGLLSSISAVVITQTVPAELLHIGKTMLHFFRYLEYFSILFIVVASVKTTQHLKIFLAIIAITVLSVTIYGYGQRNWYWPVYSTMNREFSKGIRLYLTEHARVQSTFGGHYDLAAYLVVITPILLAGFYLLKNKSKWLLLLVFFAAYWLLISTASRSSYAAFAIAIEVVILLAGYLLRQSWQRRLWWISSQSIIIGVICVVLLVNFGEDLSERIVQSIEGVPVVNTIYKESATRSAELKTTVINTLISKRNQDKIEAAKPTPPPNGISVEDAEVLVASDTRPTPARPSDVYVDVPVYETVATVSADGTTSDVTIEKDRTYSSSAQKYGLSLAIRLDALWPRALAGFYTNPFLGSGYATLTKEVTAQFTEAESTDNNFLRTLGETGLLGFITFYGTVWLSLVIAWRLLKNKQLEPIKQVFVIAFIGSTCGLLVNAVLIDVFAASKVAFTYWAFAGLVLAIQQMEGEFHFSFDYLNRIPWFNQGRKPTQLRQKRKKN